MLALEQKLNARSMRNKIAAMARSKMLHNGRVLNYVIIDIIDRGNVDKREMAARGVKFEYRKQSLSPLYQNL